MSVLFWQKLEGLWYLEVGTQDRHGQAQLFIVIGDPAHAVWRRGPGLNARQVTPGWFGLYPNNEEYELVSEPISEGRWVHHAATYDPVSQLGRLYTDGQLVEETRNVGSATELEGALDYHVRAEASGSCATSPMLDDLAVWKRALTAEEIRTVMERGPLELATAVSPWGHAAATWGGLRESRRDGASR